MAMYNMTQLQAADTIFKFVQYANTSTNDMLLGLLVIGVFFIMLLSMKRLEFEYALLASSALSFIVSAIFTYSHLLNFIFPLIFLIMAALTTLYLWLSGE